MTKKVNPETIEELHKEAKWQYQYELNRANDIDKKNETLLLIISFIFTASLGSSFVLEKLSIMPIEYNFFYLAGIGIIALTLVGHLII